MTEAFGTVDHERTLWAEYSQGGLFILTIGVVLNALPIVGIAGSFVTMVGIARLVEGRHLFDRKHSLHIVTGSVAFAIGAVLLVAASVGYVLFFYAIATFYPGDSVIPGAVVQLLPAFFFLYVVGSISAAAGYSVLTYRLQHSSGRILVLLGLVVSVAMSLSSFALLSSLYQTQLARAYQIGTFPFASGTGYFHASWDYDVGYNFETQLLLWSSLALVPAVMFAAAFYRAKSHLEYPPLRTS